MQTLDGGGAEKMLINLLNDFDYEKYSVDLCVIYREGVLLNDVPPQVNFLEYNHFWQYIRVHHLCLKYKLMNLYYLLEKPAFRCFVKQNYDVIISFLEGLPLLFHSFILNRGGKNISWVHTDAALNSAHLSYFGSKKHESRVYNQMSDIIFVSDNAKRGLNSLYHLSGARQWVINNFLTDADDICRKAEQTNVQKDGFLIVCSGRLTGAKRFDRAINVAKILKDKSLSFEMRIIGEGSLRNQLQSQIDILGLNDCVKLIGWQKNPYSQMRAADIFLLTSDMEGGPLVVCEAICLGLAIVSTDVGYVKDVLEDGKYGIITSFSEEEIADKIESLMSNQAELKKYSALSKVNSKKFNSKKNIQNIYSVIDGDRK